MKLKNKLYFLCLTLTKIFKVLLIRSAFFYPTLKTKFLLKSLNCVYGKNLKICGKVYLRLNSINSIELGNNVSLSARYLTNPLGTSPIMLECIENGSIKIGDNSGMTSVLISSRSSVKIGENVNIGGNSKIFDHDFHSTSYLERRKGGNDFGNVKTAAVVIEDDVFIGCDSIILKGVHIGARSIIAAGSVVSCKHIPPDSLVFGNPARVMKNMCKFWK